ncbi:MAG: PadR family transcriptional regulator [Roseiarcus sp.]|jgi:DNA-binding PadR family transcriptional regulator
MRERPPFGPRRTGDESADFERAAHWRGLFGRHRGGPFARWRGPRMFDSGALRLLVLGLIAEAPRHGYDIIRDLHDRFQGAYRPSPGSIYPILQTLAEAGLVTSETHGRQRLFAVTDEGRAYLADQRAELDAINAQLEEAARPIGESAIGEAIRELRAALYDKLRKGALSPTQAARLRDALERARREIEEI